MWVKDVDLPHSKQHPRLQNCWQRKLGWMEAVNWETLAMVSVAPLLGDIGDGECGSTSSSSVLHLIAV
jgi:hypothetical protein